MKKKIRINFQKLFCFASFIFILVCFFWYGGRFIYFYLDTQKSLNELTAINFATKLKNDNYESENFRQIDKNYYFYKDATNNYVSYSNLLWRIIKINKDNSITLITDSIIGTLAYGNKESSYKDSNLINWLNNDKFINVLNNKDKYLTETSTCIDNINNIEDITCKMKEKNFYLGILSLEDYINVGANNSFINNNKYNYLSNKNSDNEIWYINDKGKIDTTDGSDILGIKATITLKSTIKIKNGIGTKEEPYTFEEETGLIGSYVKLGQDTWRIYEEKDGLIKLILQETLKENEVELKHIYSKNNYFHNDTSYGSLAYYLNKTYYKSLNYKDLIIEANYANGMYGNNNNYEYKDISSKIVETKVSLPSIDDVIFNDNLNDYFTNTGKLENDEAIYVRKSNGFTASRTISTESYIIPCISIKKENLTIGTGSYSDPYRTE